MPEICEVLGTVPTRSGEFRVGLAEPRRSAASRPDTAILEFAFGDTGNRRSILIPRAALGEIVDHLIEALERLR